MTLRRAIVWSLFWVACSLAFAGVLLAYRGQGAAQLFLSAYAVEKSLSVDNLMVFAAIFAYFRIPLKDQPEILYFGFIGAALFRLLFLLTGTVLIGLHPVVGLIFGCVVIVTAIPMLSGGDDEATDYEAKWFVNLARKLSASTIFVCLIAIEISDLIFSFDSMPAVLAITSDPVIVYSAVMLAVLGLRTMYFLLAALMVALSRLTLGVVAILFFIGGKLMAKSIGEMANFNLEVGPGITLGVIFGCLAAGVIASILYPEAKTEDA